MAIAALVLVALAFGAGLVHLLRLRYARGDVYPPYSSLRADPLGTKVLHDALAESGALVVRRNVESWSRLEGGAGTTVLILGLSHLRDADHRLLEFVQRLALRGTRVVIALAPGSESPGRREDAEEEDAGTEVSPPARRWGFEQVRGRSIVGREARRAEAATRTTGTGLPDLLPWRSNLVFEAVEDPWQVRYTLEGHAVMLERPLGSGSIVVSGDAYLISNEAMRRDRYAGLLVWMLGPASKVIFEETIHGVEESVNIAVLLRRYGLATPALALLLLAALAVWSAGAPLLPRRADRGGDLAMVAGRDSAAGLVTLLRRAVRPPDLLRTCVEEWARSRGAVRAAEIERIRSLALNPRDPLGDYRRIHALLTPMEGDHDR